MRISVVATALAFVVVCVGSPGQAQNSEQLAKSAYDLLKSRCYDCHGKQLLFEKLRVLDRDSLVAERGARLKPFVTPGAPEKSKLWDVIDKDVMPLDGKPFTPAEKATIKEWITQSATFPNLAASREFYPRRQILQAIDSFLSRQQISDRQFYRFFSFDNLHNNPGISDSSLRLYRAALSKALNSMSREAAIRPPQIIEPQQVVLAVDLRWYGWKPLEDWKKVVDVYPYGLKPSDVDEFLDYRNIEDKYGATFDGIAYYRADWFVNRATRPDLYHHLTQTPATRVALEKSLGIDFANNFKLGQVLRAGRQESGVSSQNRLVERHNSKGGGSYWLSYDFKTNGGRGNLVRFPLGPKFEGNEFSGFAFEHAGGEIIYTRPNGLHGYMLVNDDGKIIDDGPVEIVSDKLRTSGNPKIINGLSCMACHRHGIITFEDDFLESVDLGNNDAMIKFRQLFKAKDIDDAMKRDRTDFLRALGDAISPFYKDSDTPFNIEELPEPVSELAEQYQKDVDATSLAIEFNYRPGARPVGAAGRESYTSDLPIKLQAAEFKSLGMGILVRGHTLKRSMLDERDGGITPFQRIGQKLAIGIPVP